MSTSWHLTYSAEKAETLEAMRLAGKYVFRGRRAIYTAAFLVVLVVLAPIGALGLVFLFKQMMTGQAGFENALIVPALVLMFGGFTVLLNTKIYDVMAEASVSSRFGRKVTVTIDQTGFTFAGGRSVWQMAWSDVDKVVKGRKSLSIVTGAVALPVPVSAFADAKDAQTAFAQMQSWHEAEA